MEMDKPENSRGEHAVVDANSVEKPEKFTMSIQGGMLEALGINMYTTLGKCLVEFIANAYDAESPEVNISIPVTEIDKARSVVRERAKEDLAKQAAKTGTQAKSLRGLVLLLALPETVKVTIRDAGNGMTPKQVQDVFLPVNRKRRLSSDGTESNLKTENGLRFAMGRKGLGKLAGFGAAETVRIETKRKGQNFATSFTMCYADLAKAQDLQRTELEAKYIEGKSSGEHYTLIELSGLKCDAVRNSVDTIRNTISEAFFGILPEEFAIKINDELVVAEEPSYEFTHPNGTSVDAEGFAEASINIDDLTDPLNYKYVVKFREKGAHLPAAKRGARIYCNNRLAAGPTLLDLPTGMHNFHAQSYMECVVIADELDRFGVDIINTNRTHLRQDSELVEKFLNTITSSMEAAIKAHSRFRDGKAEQEIQANTAARTMTQVASQLPKRTRGPIKKLLNTMASKFGVESSEFQEVAPLVINAANASEVLIKLIEAGADPQSIENVAAQLRDLAEIEKSDALKLYRGRRNGIAALAKLEIEGEADWKGSASEGRLHDLFKDQPWLIKPEFIRPIVSDQDLTKLATKIAKSIGVDKFSPPMKNGKSDLTRPDLVFMMTDTAMPSVITIVELKSPTVPLEIEHLNQLKRYMRKVKDFVEVELSARQCVVQGILIGALPDPSTTADGSRDLLHEIKNRGVKENWEVRGLRELIEHARQIHQEAIETLERELAQEDEPAVEDSLVSEEIEDLSSDSSTEPDGHAVANLASH
jgi:hypothetical protein